MKILLFDPITAGNVHVAFNATMVESLIRIPSVTTLTLLLEQKQLTQCVFEEVLDHPIIDVYPLPELPNNIGHKFKGAKVFRAFSSYRQFYCVARKVLPDIVILLAADNVLTPLAFRFLGHHWKHKTWRLLIVFHNNIENMRLQHSVRKLRLIQSLWAGALNRPYSEILVLSEFLKNSITQFLPGTHVKYLPHPTYANIHSRYINPKQAYIKDIDFLFLGRHALEASKSGFLDEFIATVSKIWNYESGDSIRAKIALPSSLCIRNEQAIELELYNYYPTIHGYLNLIARSRFVVIPPSSEPRLTASGILADTLTIGVPITAPNTGPFAENAASQKEQFLYSKKEELEEILMAVKSLTKKEYLSIQSSILKYSAGLSVVSTSLRLKKILDDLYLK